MASRPAETYAEARRRRERARADAIEMQNAVKRGELLPAAEVREVLVRGFSAINNKLGALPSKLAHVLRPDDPHVARRHLELAAEEMRAELRSLDLGQAVGEERAAEAAE